jgi:1,2-diacylglycerol 3-alpha-glucosyltransferase
MLFVAPTLEMNGVSTFILRIAKECKLNHSKFGVLVLTSKVDPAIQESIKAQCSIYYLHDFLKYSPLKFLSKTPLVPFLPLKTNALTHLFEEYSSKIHISSVFGLLFVHLLYQKFNINMNCNLAIYHQNEFVFRTRSFYFVESMKVLVKEFKDNAFIFFNSICHETYTQFFQRSFEGSPILPIGVNISSEAVLQDYSKSRKIVSIGNLYEFKQYNQLIINLMPQLLKIDSRFTYEIYGDGPFRPQLEELILKLNLKNVFLKGQFKYELLNQTLKDTFLFVGSGTAIIEAASLYIPSMVGIESVKAPITYGYLSDVHDLTYNEYVPTRKTEPMLNKITFILDEVNWKKVASNCRKKTEEFSISKTYQGFVSSTDTYSTKIKINYFRIIFSILYCALLHVLRIDTAFKNRRNQTI